MGCKQRGLSCPPVPTSYHVTNRRTYGCDLLVLCLLGIPQEAHPQFDPRRPMHAYVYHLMTYQQKPEVVTHLQRRLRDGHSCQCTQRQWDLPT